MPGFIGTFMRDTCPILKPGQSMVVNTDWSYGPGIHWLAVVRTPKTNSVTVYLNSSGNKPLPEIQKTFKTKRVFYNNAPLQMDNSVACGYYAIDFVKSCAGKSIEEINEWLNTKYEPSQTLNNEVAARTGKFKTKNPNSN